MPLQQLTAAGYELVLTGHSLGAGVASLLSLLLRSRLRQPTVRCFGFATPCCACGEARHREMWGDVGRYREM